MAQILQTHFTYQQKFKQFINVYDVVVEKLVPLYELGQQRESNFIPPLVQRIRFNSFVFCIFRKK